MGEAKRKELATQGALLLAHEAFHAGDVDKLHKHLHFLLGLGDLEENPGLMMPPKRVTEGDGIPTESQAFGAAFRDLCRRYGVNACAVVPREVMVEVGGIDPVTKLITPRRMEKQLSFQAHGDQEIIAQLQKRMRNEGGDP